MKKYIITFVWTFIQMTAIAQTVNVHFKNGQTIKYHSSNVDYVDFSAKAPDPTVSSGTVVDLGLSVYWASCNVGAESPEEYGSYFAWGETSEKDRYYDENYTFYDSNTAQYIDIGDDIAGTEYDAATVNLGTDWQMPTKAEFQELIDKCTWEWTQLNGINGYRVTGTNGNSIFLPAAGGIIMGYNSFQNQWLYYWTSTQKISSNNLRDAINYCKQDNTGHISATYKYYGLSIRPVTSNPNAGEAPIDHSQDYLVTENISSMYVGGSYSSYNNLINSGSQLNWRFSNNSTESVTLTGIQIIDGATGNTTDNILSANEIIAAGTSQTYTVTVGTGGIHKPVTVRFTYRYNGKKYTVEATMPD